MNSMVAFAQNSEIPFSTYTRARAPRRAGVSVAIACQFTNETSTLHEDSQRTLARLVTCSREPIGFRGKPVEIFIEYVAAIR